MQLCKRSVITVGHSRILNGNIQFPGLHDFKISNTFLTKLNEALNLQIPLMKIVLHSQSTLCQEEKYCSFQNSGDICTLQVMFTIANF